MSVKTQGREPFPGSSVLPPAENEGRSMGLFLRRHSTGSRWKSGLFYL